MKRIFIIIASFVMFATSVIAEMSKIDDSELADVTGQSGVYLTGEISFNETGGPHEVGNSYFGICGDPGTESCGARLTFQTQQGGGWFVIDDIRGSISFEGLTFQVRNISSALEFGGDGQFFGRDVLEIGLPESIRMNDFQFTLATGSSGRPDDASYKQVDLMTVEMSGEITLQGNLLVFPTP